MKRLAFILLLCVTMLLVAIWRMPASLMVALLPTNVAERIAAQVSIHEMNGTVWNGNARFTLAAVPPTQRIRWRCTPDVLSLSIDCALSESVSGALRFSLAKQTINLTAVKATLPLKINAANAGQFASDLASIDITSAELSSSTALVSAAMKAEHAVLISMMNPSGLPIALGEISLDCTPVAATKTSRCTLRNRASAQRVDGQIDLAPNKASGAITFTPAGGVSQQISF
jgi:hypothetical protein